MLWDGLARLCPYMDMHPAAGMHDRIEVEVRDEGRAGVYKSLGPVVAIAALCLPAKRDGW